MSDPTRRGVGLLSAALALGVTGDWLLRGWPWGLSLPLWIAAVLLLVAGLARWSGPPFEVGRAGRALAFPILFFAGGVAWRDSPALVGLNLLAMALSLALAALYGRAGRLAVASIADYAIGSTVVGLSTLFGPLILMGDDIRWREVASSGRFGSAPAAARGVVLAIPLVLGFGALFASADAAFQRFANAVVHVDTADLLVHALVIIAVAWAIAGWGRQLF